MKTMILADGHIPSPGLGTGRRALVWLLALAVALAAQAHCLAQKVLFYDDFESVSEWGGPYGSGAAYASWRLENEQAIMSFNRPEPTDPSAVPGWYAAWEPNRTYTFGTNTLEFSIDLVESNRDDAFALLTVNELGALSGYMFGVDRNQAFFCNANEVLWQRDVHDTTAQDQVLRNRGWKGLQMDPEGYSPPVSGTLEVGIGIVYLNTQEAPTEPIEVTVDNYTVLQYPAAAISEVHSVLLPWPENTFDEQIVVGADSSASDALWTPWPEPIFKRSGEPCLAVPTTATQQFFKLVPGTQFIDDFSDPQEPFAGPSFDFKPGTPYRLVFSGVGTRLSVELIDLELQQPAVAALVVTDSRFSQGFVGFFMEVGAALCDMTLDNFFATGTKL